MRASGISYAYEGFVSPVEDIAFYSSRRTLCKDGSKIFRLNPKP